MKWIKNVRDKVLIHSSPMLDSYLQIADVIFAFNRKYYPKAGSRSLKTIFF